MLFVARRTRVIAWRDCIFASDSTIQAMCGYFSPALITEVLTSCLVGSLLCGMKAGCFRGIVSFVGPLPIRAAEYASILRFAHSIS